MYIHLIIGIAFIWFIWDGLLYATVFFGHAFVQETDGF
jgi:hypothetical protein